jgi:nicotinamidase-related amidase
MPHLDRCALVIVDVQKGFDDLSYRSQTGRRNKPACERNDGNALKPELTGQPALVTKQTNSAFYGERDLHARLQARGMTSFAVCGIQTNHCVETHPSHGHEPARRIRRRGEHGPT